jgi:hypothetical protein
MSTAIPAADRATAYTIDFDSELGFFAMPQSDDAGLYLLPVESIGEAEGYAERIGLTLAARPLPCDGDCFAEKDDGINHANLAL